MPSRWRVELARALAWALLLAGWLGIAALADRLAAGPLQAFGLIALWLLGLGAAATLLGRLRLSAWSLRALLLGGALVTAGGLFAASHGHGLAALLPAVLAWALLGALASATVRSLRLVAPRRPGPPLRAAAFGALLAWGLVGDPADLPALVPRLAGLLLGAAVLLALLQPRAGESAARPGCRAGLFDCSLPAWPVGGWLSSSWPQRWPLRLATLVMLPMMCSLPQMLALCRSEALPAQAVLGLHLAAMFVPALLWRTSRSPARLCALLLAVGGLGVWLSGPVAAGWLALAHGSAWSLAWGAMLADPAERAGAYSSPLRAACGHAGLALALGAAVAMAGLQAVFALQGLIALLALAALLVQAGSALRQHGSEPLESLPRRLRR